VHLDTSVLPLLVWKVNGSAVGVNWKPVAQYVMEAKTSYPASDNLIHINAVSQWTYWLVENDPDGGFPLPHPFHLHGHDFVVLARSPNATPLSQTRYVFNQAQDIHRLSGQNPARRDPTMLPARR